MVKIRVSYEHQRELQRVLEKLGDDVKKIKEPKQQEGKYKKAYIEIKKWLNSTYNRIIIFCKKVQLKQKRGDNMSYDEIKDFIGKDVILTDVDGKKFKGKIYNTESEFDTSSGKEEIEMKVGSAWYGIPFDEIKSIMEIK